MCFKGLIRNENVTCENLIEINKSAANWPFFISYM